MQFKQSFPKTRLLFACLLLFSFFIIHQSCTKIDTVHPGNRALTDEEVTQKFFDLPANAPLAVRRAAAEMKSRNAVSEFVKSFVKNNGYPVWDKALIPAQPVTNVSFTGNIQETDTVVVIPVIPQSATYVSSFVRATLNGTADLDFFRGNDYAAYSFNDVPADSVNADKAAMQIMLLNNRVFGYTKFRVVDKRLFHPSSDYSDTAHISRTLTLSGTPGLSGGVNTSNLFQTCMTVITTSTTNHCPYPPGQCTGINGSCDNCAAVCASVVSESHLICGVWEDGGGSGPTGSPDPGGGTTGGGGTGTTFPCASSQSRTIGVADPCGPGTNPPPVVPIPTLANQIIIDSLAGYPCAQSVLAAMPSVNAQVKAILLDVFGVNDDVNIIFQAHQYAAGVTTDGELRTWQGGNYNIWISTSMLSTASKDYIAAVLIHEAVHAYIVRMRPSYFNGHGGAGGNGMDSATFAQHFPIYMQNLGPNAQHYEMAGSYITYMKNAIQSYNPTLTNYNAEALAWGGLEMTTVWQSRADSMELVLRNLAGKYTNLTFPDSSGAQVNYSNFGYKKCP